MIPQIDSKTIENNGERLFYDAAAALPNEYTVLYSYKYPIPSNSDDWITGEADFVVVHPCMGYVVFEVKQGDIRYSSGQWYEYKIGGYRPLAKDPIEQARRAMYSILDRWKAAAGEEYFPLKAMFAVCFSESPGVSGDLPSYLKPGSVLSFQDLDYLDERLRGLFGGFGNPRQDAVSILVKKVLAPSFSVYSRLEDQMEVFHRTAERILTEEQERILEETSMDKRKVFFGSAGTGKTYLAMEKARRLAAAGRRVLLTCFNRNLATYLRSQVPAEIAVGSFHDYLVDVLNANGHPIQVPAEKQALRRFYDVTLIEAAVDFFDRAPADLKYDSIIVDEGQDFKEEWYICLESMLRPDSEFYVFADPNQDLFQAENECLKRYEASKQRLTRNLRNSERISDWLRQFVREGSVKAALPSGMPVEYHAWETTAEEKKLVEQVVGRLVSQGIKLSRILILSPNRLEKTCLAGLTKVKEWPLADFRQAKGHEVRFATIRSFKGLEADIVLLIGLKEGKQTCTDMDIYVGGSRARFILHVFHHKTEPPKRLPRVGC